MVDPGKFSVERIPGSNRSLVRLYQNVTPIQQDDFTGFEYDEYRVEVETWDGVAQNVRDNYDEFLAKGIDNEVDRSNEALFRAQAELEASARDTDAMTIDQEYRLTLLELGMTETDI
jgi:maltooligosyltrehalose synthase